mmetsp:Transcript_8828/g.14561  ORF Transcript_8828/g.14561 Transcript_8828/m.14561 type:complete len:277 (-) Transcript_8828:258-1088(-)
MSRRRSSANPQQLRVKRKLYLITDEFFPSALVANLIAMVAAMGIVYLHRPYREYVINAYFAINERMMAVANRYAWWSMLGLLSSSCCALQIVLNAVSLGCSGINNFLGPFRPTLLAFAIISMLVSWAIAWPRPFQWRSTALSTGFSAFLTLLPELVDLHTRRKAQRRRLRQALDDGKLDDLLLHPDNGNRRTLYFHIPTLGCASCVSTVSSILGGLEIENAVVVNHRVLFEDSICEVVVALTDDNRNHDLLWHLLSSELAKAGFPANRIKETKKDR